MRIHHLSCGSPCPHGGRFAGGEGGLFCSHDPHYLARQQAVSVAAA